MSETFIRFRDETDRSSNPRIVARSFTRSSGGPLAANVTIERFRREGRRAERVTYQAGEGAHHRSVTESDRDRTDAHELRRRESRDGAVSRDVEIFPRAWRHASVAVCTHRGEAALASVRPTRHVKTLCFDPGDAP